ncbi:formyltetrahydrofolate deformylase [Leeia sp. TBRC 13508]|uniref:Formyltetrahydrofolate deformylase n=1 Tax=Leeia speluncae TaxID=2884804 RepID=A0ABS8D8A9_9NEIS|nr:formyltetrahydrofolate deformylase [Leeia speluncae]MCB6184454.1 formyltetrahydrofolate deformylase [Leeia speluncae]
MTTPTRHKMILSFTCPSAAGQVAAVSQFLDQRGCYIDEIAVFDDEDTQRFFVRCVFHLLSKEEPNVVELKKDFAPIGEKFEMEWDIRSSAAKAKVLLMVSKLDHCLNDLLYRWKMGDLEMDVTAVVSNHPDLKPIADNYGIPYYHFPITADTKPEQEAAVIKIIEETQSELVVLARYMQVLSPELSAKLSGKAINIHHSFLPGFKGAKPYHQAHARGVKLIGATAHYVTDDLDEGPIIEQVVERVDHSHRPEQLLTTGRDMECLALSRAVKFHLERRVFMNDSRTVVLR